MPTLIDKIEGFRRARALLNRIFMRGKARFIFSIIIVLSAKILSSIFMHHRLSTLGSFFTQWMSAWPARALSYDWLYLYCAWDTGFYVQIAENWYSYPAYAFFPAYPSIVRILSFMLRDSWLSAFIVSFGLGIACVPVFQALAEEYCSRTVAFTSTMIMAFFPYIFLFTTIAYTESLFLLSSILTWYFYKKGKLIQASLAACIASLTKMYGIFIIIPIFVDIIYNRRFKRTLYLSFPIFALLAWLFYLFSTTGDWLIFMSSQSYWIERGMKLSWIQAYLVPLLDFKIWKIPQSHYLLIALITFFAYPIFTTLGLDWRLGAYSLTMYFSLLFFSNFISLPRFFSFVFPIWLNSKFKNPLILVLVIPFFTIISLLIWYHFLLGEWIA